MNIKKIKHDLFIDNAWRTLVFEDNTCVVYVMIGRAFNYETYLRDKKLGFPYNYRDKQFNQIEAIFKKDWSKYE